MPMRALTPDEREQSWNLGSEAFNAPEERKALFLAGFRAEHYTGIFDAGPLVAQAHPFQQFFGGRSVSMDGDYSDLGGDFEIRVGELIATTPDASRALWRLLGSWDPQVERILYRGPFDDPLLLLGTEQNTRVLAEGRWMTRLVNAHTAIESRGYPAAVDAEVHLSLRDEILGDNDGDFVLRVVGGEAALEPGGKGEIALDVGAATALYTGASSCAALARAGGLRGGSPAAWHSLDAVFAAAPPWMPDEF